MPTLQINGIDIDGSRVVCTGSQIALLLDLLSREPELSGCHWYAGALDNFGPAIDPYQPGEPRLVYDFKYLVESVRSTQQLLDGIFVAMRSEEKPILLSQLFTADGPMEKVVENCIVEVHAFDTSWIELYSNDTALIRRFADRFPGAKWHN
jgi:hypothetical protein